MHDENIPFIRREDRGHSTPCWIWQRALDDKGYGVWYFNRRFRGAHTVYYRLIVGPVPEGLELDHLCRVPACVNPEHLEPVTHAENIRRRGDRKLSREAAALIRADCDRGILTPARKRGLARQFGVSVEMIRRVAVGKAWVPDE